MRWDIVTSRWCLASRLTRSLSPAMGIIMQDETPPYGKVNLVASLTIWPGAPVSARMPVVSMRSAISGENTTLSSNDRLSCDWIKRNKNWAKKTRRWLLARGATLSTSNASLTYDILFVDWGFQRCTRQGLPKCMNQRCDSWKPCKSVCSCIGLSTRHWKIEW